MKYKLPIIIISMLITGITLGTYFNSGPVVVADDLSFDEQEATIRAIKKNLPAVVSIATYEERDLPMVTFGPVTEEKRKKIEKEAVEIGAGTGFLITSDGLILTNKHVIETKGPGEYRITLHNGKKYYAQLIGKDPLNDLAILKIFDKDLPFVELGDSDKLEIGSTVIAIGNALGQYQNSVSKGIVSALSRNILADDKMGGAEILNNTIQIDADINLGNSGGPLIDLMGKVVGVNVAIDQGGSSLGFAIPVSDIRPVVRSAIEIGRIVRPRLGVRYQMLDEEFAEAKKLTRNSGALIVPGDDGVAIFPDSPASESGLKEGDIIFEVNAIPVNKDNGLLNILQRYKPGDRIGLKVQRQEKVLIIVVTLGEFQAK